MIIFVTPSFIFRSRLFFFVGVPDFLLFRFFNDPFRSLAVGMSRISMNALGALGALGAMLPGRVCISLSVLSGIRWLLKYVHLSPLNVPECSMHQAVTNFIGPYLNLP